VRAAVEERHPLVEQLLEAIKRKLEANKAVVARSLRFGRLNWRTTQEGKIEVDLELKL
jgi:hypothetical protein